LKLKTILNQPDTGEKMRKPFMAGNWKMNMLTDEAVALAKALVDASKGLDVEVGIAPAYTVIPAVAEVVKGSDVRLMAQNMYWEDKGAYTGEISPLMVKDSGCSHVIIGHSERRQFFSETDETVNKKLKAAYSHDILPIACIGETLEEREAGNTLSVIETQLKGALDGISSEDAAEIVIAYEPVWAIGTGKTATSDQAQEVHAHIRKLLADLYSQDVADGIRIQYGGSVKPANVKELMNMPDIDGALVGGAALTSENFVPIMEFQK
jgi:triosephosphate isomerase (TIM)